MGLSAFIAAFRGSKTKDNVPQRHSPPRREQHKSNVDDRAARAREENLKTTCTSFPHPGTDLPTVPPSAAAPFAEQGNHKRKEEDQTPSLSRSKLQRRSSTRRSWFGGRPDCDDNIPAVPKLLYVPKQPDTNRARQDSDALREEKQPKRSSIASRKERKPADDERSFPGRYSLYPKHQKVTIEATRPALPLMPVDLAYSKPPTRSTLSSGRRPIRTESASSSKPRRTSRPSYRVSSIADESDSDIPPVPALVRDVSSDTGSNSSFDDARIGEVKQVLPLSVSSKKSHVPKSAGKGILKATNGACEETRRSYRRSYKTGDDVDLFCVAEEQQAPWKAYQRAEEQGSRRRQSKRLQGMAVEVDEKTLRSNAQALAALDFWS